MPQHTRTTGGHYRSSIYTDASLGGEENATIRVKDAPANRKAGLLIGGIALSTPIVFWLLMGIVLISRALINPSF
ncbi:MAG: hypothetical protein Q4P78_02920 [Rothia sp. (in: high G+C Gram-positive bacteria)]|uniref:hypothetical protein n=1 Tax=Rothia sp. (in: high G+C Gram-positive bacteria) TaxID=1885016 RepID=UPI0026E02862|nr:hypothetical protein [Rothia sp. (in: high G+C Gram-positive bacteria)]MDO5750142.1 hypothetical protein [Rothia sp. (in: high G+C Gram-positive bacteria)]